MIFLHSKFILNKLKFYHTNLSFQEVSFSKSKMPTLSGSLVWTFKFMEWINKHSWSCPSLKLEVRLPGLHSVGIQRPRGLWDNYVFAGWICLAFPHCPVVAPEMLQECCGIHLSGWCICCLREGLLQARSSFLCTAGSGWLARHLAGLRNDGAESRRMLWWSGRSDTALFESPFDGEGPATQRHQVLETCVGQVWGPQEWDVSRTKRINLKAIRDRADFLNHLFT